MIPIRNKFFFSSIKIRPLRACFLVQHKKNTMIMLIIIEVITAEKATNLRTTRYRSMHSFCITLSCYFSSKVIKNSRILMWCDDRIKQQNFIVNNMNDFMRIPNIIRNKHIQKNQNQNFSFTNSCWFVWHWKTPETHELIDLCEFLSLVWSDDDQKCWSLWRIFRCYTKLCNLFTCFCVIIIQPIFICVISINLICIFSFHPNETNRRTSDTSKNVNYY